MRTVAQRGPIALSWPWAVASEPGTRAVVWCVWAVLLLAALACIALYGSNIPLAEDWHFVAPLTGHEPDFWAWLWAQNNEHRTPLHRLLLLLVLWSSGMDFRAGMVLNVVVLAALAAAMMSVARELRGGLTSYADAFFPLVLLHLGNWPNLIWGWQFQFVLSTALHLIVLLVIVAHPGRLESGRAVLAGACVVLLPLAGASSLAFVPPCALWLAWHGVLNWRASVQVRRNRATSLVLFACAATALALTALYFVGYERAYWNPPSPGLIASIKTTGAFLALSLGPAARLFWAAAVLVAVAFMVSGTAATLAGAWRSDNEERIRALSLVLFGSGVVALALGVGWGRAGLVPTVGMPIRYVLPAAPALCLVYFAWLLYGGPLARRLVPMSLCGMMVLLLPVNTKLGLSWGDWYRDGMAAVQRDIDAALHASAMAERHREFLLHWDQPKLEASIRMLQAAGVGPFARRGDAGGRPDADDEAAGRSR